MMRLLRFICTTSLLLTCAICYFSQIHHGWPFYLACSLAVAFGMLAMTAVRCSVLLLVAGFCVLPMFGAGTLSIALCGWLLGSECRLLIADEWEERSSAERLLWLGFLAFLLAMFGAAVQPLLRTVDVPLLTSMYFEGGAAAVYRFLRSEDFRLLALPRELAGYLLVILLTTTVCRLQRVHSVFSVILYGLTIGAFAAAVLLLLQYFEIHPLLSLQRNAFWRFVGRYSAGFSDPNAFGIFSVMAVPVLLFAGMGKRRYWMIAAAVALIAVVPWSGSRSVWLGFGLWILYSAAVRVKHAPSRRLRLAAAGSVIGVLMVPLALGYPVLNLSLQEAIPAPGITRLLDTFNWQNGFKRFESRVLYSRIALRMWQEEPFSGVGLGRFYHRQAATAKEAGIQLGPWRDNANNFYLHVLAEGGIIALAVLLFAMVLIARAVSTSSFLVAPDGYPEHVIPPMQLQRLARVSLGIFSLLLLLGPHVHFEEVRYFLALLFAFGVCYGSITPVDYSPRAYRGLMAVTLLVPMAYLLLFLLSDADRIARGFYGVEQGSDGDVRWTAGEAYFSWCGAAGGRNTIEVKAPRPISVTAPVTVEFARQVDGSYEVFRTIELEDPSWKTILLPPTDVPSEDPQQYRLVVTPLWNPSGGSSQGDVRWLGVMMKWPEAVCR